MKLSDPMQFKRHDPQSELLYRITYPCKYNDSLQPLGLFVEWLLPVINGAYVINEGVKLFMITLLFFRHYTKNICILRNRLINFITVNLQHG